MFESGCIRSGVIGLVLGLSAGNSPSPPRLNFDS